MATTTRVTLREFLDQDGGKPYREYVCGEVIEKPMPKRSHAFLQIFLGGLLVQFLARAGLGRAGTEWRCVFGPPGRERALIPDIAYIAQARLTEAEDFFGAPNLAVEIISPGQSRTRLMDKVLFYLLHGVRMVWVIDPEERTVLVLEPGRDGLLLEEGDTLDGGEVLPGFSLRLTDLFAQLSIGPAATRRPEQD